MERGGGAGSVLKDALMPLQQPACFFWIYKTIPVTPAIKAGITDCIQKLRDLLT
jgi:hypothetical protein